MTERGDEAVRKEFEAWYVKEFDCSPDAWFATQNRYYHGHTQQRWATWQASRNAAIQECADKMRAMNHPAYADMILLALKER